MSKILEKVAFKQIDSIVAQNELRVALDKSKVVLMAVIDLTKAFDLVDITLLVDKHLHFSDAACN